MDCDIEGDTAADDAAMQHGGARPSMEEAAEQGEVQQDEGSVVLGVAKAAAHLRCGLGLLVRDVPVWGAGVHQYLVRTC